MTKGQKIKNLIKQRGLDPEMVAKAMGVSPSSLFEYYKRDDFKTSTLEQLAPILNVDISYFFTKNMNGKTAIGNHAVAGDGNCVVSMPPAGYIVIISPDGEVQQVKVSGMGDSEVIRGLSEELDRKKDEVMELQRRVIELQDRIIALKG